MIKEFKDAWLKDFYLNDKSSRKIPADIRDRLFRKLQLIDDATCDLDLRVPPSNHFKKLSGKLARFHAIRVNKQWRLIFEWDGGHGEAKGLYLDSHKYQ